VPRVEAEVGSAASSYEILAKLATGGMAEIFLARGASTGGLERYVVLKRILRHRAHDQSFVRMFLDEARLAAQLQHPNIAQVYDIGKLGDSYFFTMEYVHGETVRALLHRAQGLRRQLPINCVLTIAAGTAAGLHHAHARLGFDGRALGIVHRDVSPSNLMVSYEGGVKVVDFGVAKAADRAQETKSGTVKGKISYLSPEQCKGKRVDRRSDLFSLGICFWEMLTTERLYKRASDFENMNAIVTEDTPPPSSRRSDVPPEIDELVLRLLAKTPEQRFQTADEVVDAIEGVASRTASVLSASVLGRFVRELFGQRPEPWLELEGQQEHGEPVTVTSEPIPRELAIPVADEVNHQLASVLDLSSPPSVTESLEVVPADVPTAQLGKRALLGFPLAAPPPTHPGIARSVPDPETASPLPPPPAGRTMPSYSSSVSPLPSSDAHTQSLSAATPPSAAAYTPSSGEVLVPAVVPPSGVTPSGPRSASLVAPGVVASGPGSASIVAPPGPAVSSSGAFASASGSQDAVRVSASHSTPERRRRVPWPLYAVIGGAALVGSIAVMIMMRSGSSETLADAGSAAKASDSIGNAAAPSSTVTVSPITVVPIEPGEPDAISSPDRGIAAPPAAVASANGSGDSGPRMDLPGRPGGARPEPAPALLRSAEPPARPPVPPRKSGPAATAMVPARSEAPAKPAPVAPVHAAGKHEPQDDEIAHAYAAGHYDEVVELCSAGPVSAEHAPLCFIAACHAGNEAKARKLIGAVPAARRDHFTTNCKQLGVDIKKADRPAEDCEADPMACQH
jgi:eukaryotic-like serine/threonine-protein kinase